MVLWRDQTCLLELYHEPLVQCMAVLLQNHVEWIPLTVQALLGPEIWSPGTTPKLIFLLHQVDTLLQMGVIWKFGNNMIPFIKPCYCDCRNAAVVTIREWPNEPCNCFAMILGVIWCRGTTTQTSVLILLRALVQRRVALESNRTENDALRLGAIARLQRRSVCDCGK